MDIIKLLLNIKSYRSLGGSIPNPLRGWSESELSIELLDVISSLKYEVSICRNI